MTPSEPAMEERKEPDFIRFVKGDSLKVYSSTSNASRWASLPKRQCGIRCATRRTEGSLLSSAATR